MPKLAWTPDGNRLLSRLPRRLTIHDASGVPLTQVARDNVLDACWRPDGEILAVDATGSERRYSATGALVSSRPTNTAVIAAEVATNGYWIAIAASVPRPDNVRVYSGNRARREAEKPPADAVVVTSDGFRVWSFDPWMYKIAPAAGSFSVGISADGSHVAIGYEAIGEPGRGWIAFSTPTWQIVDRDWHAMPLVERDSDGHGVMGFAFDGSASRFAAIAPEGSLQLGTKRLGVIAERLPRGHLGGARAVALDARGIVAAFGYPGHRLRVDYLARWQRGRPVVEIEDTLWIEPDLADVVALAFDPAGRQIACLASDGKIDVVPVP